MRLSTPRRRAVTACFRIVFLIFPAATAAGQDAVRVANYQNLEIHPDTLVLLPEPTGPHRVGTAAFHWVDTDRPETATADTGDLRQVIAQAWYPAAAPRDTVHAAYLPGLDAMRGALRTRIDSLPGRVADDLAVLGAVRGRALVDAPVAEPAGALGYPVVIFSPGGNMSRHYYTALMEELASHGYLAVAVSHAYVGWDVFPAGGFLKSADWGLNAGDPASAAGAESSLADILTGDVALVRDRLADLERGGPFEGRLDLDRIAVAGHSRGVLTVARVCETIPEVDACLAFDSIGPDAGVAIVRPWLTLRRADWTQERVRRLRAFLASVPGARVAAIEGAGHFTFSDLPIVDPANYETNIDPLRGHRVVADLALAFLGEHLRGDPGVAVEAIAATLPEVDLTRVSP